MDDVVVNEAREKLVASLELVGIYYERMLSEAAFQLLASSTMGRYLSQTQRIADEAGLPKLLGSDPNRRAAAESLVRGLLTKQSDQERRLVESEAALWLYAFVTSGPVGDVLDLAESSPSSWIRALADRISKRERDRHMGQREPPGSYGLCWKDLPDYHKCTRDIDHGGSCCYTPGPLKSDAEVNR